MSERNTVQKIQEVPALLVVPNSRIVAGGTTFDQNTEDELYLVDISGLEGLNVIKQRGRRIEIGALATLQSMADSPLLRAHAPALAEAAARVGTADVRHRGTLGGNLSTPRIGDTAAALLASGAKLTIKTDSDFRELLIDRFWDGSGRNVLRDDEWITRVTLPMPQGNCWGSAYGKVGEWDRERERIASAAVQLCMDEADVITWIRGGIRLGSNGIGRMFSMERALKNAPASEGNLIKGARAMAGGSADLADFLLGILHCSVGMARERRTL